MAKQCGRPLEKKVKIQTGFHTTLSLKADQDNYRALRRKGIGPLEIVQIGMIKLLHEKPA